MIKGQMRGLQINEGHILARDVALGLSAMGVDGFTSSRQNYTPISALDKSGVVVGNNHYFYVPISTLLVVSLIFRWPLYLEKMML
jgi:hypothetical protein